jgi:hypothetical protein
MKLPRRQFLLLAAGAAALPAVSRIAAANETIQCTGRVGQACALRRGDRIIWPMSESDAVDGSSTGT